MPFRRRTHSYVVGAVIVGVVALLMAWIADPMDPPGIRNRASAPESSKKGAIFSPPTGAVAAVSASPSRNAVIVRVRFIDARGEIVTPVVEVPLPGHGVMSFLGPDKDGWSQSLMPLKLGEYEVVAKDRRSGWCRRFSMVTSEGHSDFQFDFFVPSDQIEIRVETATGDSYMGPLSFRLTQFPKYTALSRESDQLILGDFVDAIDQQSAFVANGEWIEGKGPELQLSPSIGATACIDVRTPYEGSGRAWIDGRRGTGGVLRLRSDRTLGLAVYQDGMLASMKATVDAYTFLSFTRPEWRVRCDGNGRAQLTDSPRNWAAPVFCYWKPPEATGLPDDILIYVDELRLRAAAVTNGTIDLHFVAPPRSEWHLSEGLQALLPVELEAWLLEGAEGPGAGSRALRLGSVAIPEGGASVELPKWVARERILLVAKKPGVDVSIILSDRGQELDVAPLRTIRGFVVDRRTGGPLVGAKISSGKHEDAAGPRPFRGGAVTTNAFGAFELVVGIGDVSVLRARAMGYVDEIRPVGDSESAVVIALDPTPSAAVTVRHWDESEGFEAVYLAVRPLGTGIERAWGGAKPEELRLFAGEGEYSLQLWDSDSSLLAISPAVRLHEGAIVDIVPPAQAKHHLVFRGDPDGAILELMWHYEGWFFQVGRQIGVGVNDLLTAPPGVLVQARLVVRDSTAGLGFGPGEVVWQWNGRSEQMPRELDLAQIERRRVRIISCAMDAVLVMIPIERNPIVVSSRSRSEDQTVIVPQVRGGLDVGLSNGLSTRLLEVPSVVVIESFAQLRRLRPGPSLRGVLEKSDRWTLTIRSASTGEPIVVHGFEGDPAVPGPEGGTGKGELRLASGETMLSEIRIEGESAIFDRVDNGALEEEEK